LNKDEHVRVDIFYRDSSQKYKNFINILLGIIFLLPVILVVGFYSIELIAMSWKIQEISTEAGGLAYVFIQKTFILLFPITLFIALVNELIKIIWK
jgi:TRAP-type mannitol/chloroaromatic compound transport system permease small subunit